MITADSATRAPARAMDRHEEARAKRRTGGGGMVISSAGSRLLGPGQAQLSRGLELEPFVVWIGVKLVALSPDTAYRIGEPTAVDSLSQAADRDIDGANVQIAAVAPGVLDDVLAAQNGTGIEDEKLEQTKLLRPQAEQPSGSARALVHAIELNTSATQPCGAVGRVQERRTLVTDE